MAKTEAGLPEGLPASATIGAAGGTLTSSDGRLTTTVPAGALAANTVVEIQPITATAPGAFGSGYRLTPEGVNFAKPVTLTFNYSAAEAGASVPESLRIAARDSRGHWRVMNTTRDPARREIAVTTTHFSDWSHVGGLQIAPASATVEVNKKQFLRVIFCGDGPDPEANEQRLLLECRPAGRGADPTRWSVNSIANGNATVGTISTVAGLERFANYTAPAAVPAQNPVAVSAEFVEDPALGTTRLVSNITVVDKVPKYEGTIFGRTVTRIGGDEQFLELSANLRFTRNPDLSIGGTQWYDGTGTAVVRGRPFGCVGLGSGTATVQGATLQLQTEGTHAGTYVVSAGAKATVTMTCGNPPESVTFQMTGGAGGGGSDICPFPQIGDDPGRLASSWACNVAEGSRQTSNWTFRAVE